MLPLRCHPCEAAEQEAGSTILDFSSGVQSEESINHQCLDGIQSHNQGESKAREGSPGTKPRTSQPQVRKERRNQQNRYKVTTEVGRKPEGYLEAMLTKDIQEEEEINWVKCC